MHLSVEGEGWENSLFPRRRHFPVLVATVACLVRRTLAKASQSLVPNSPSLLFQLNSPFLVCNECGLGNFNGLLTPGPQATGVMAKLYS